MTKGASMGSLARCASMVSMSAPMSNRRRTRATMAGKERTLGKRILTCRLYVFGFVRDLDGAGLSIDLHGAEVLVSGDDLDTGDGAVGEEAQDGVPIVGWAVAEEEAYALFGGGGG